MLPVLVRLLPLHPWYSPAFGHPTLVVHSTTRDFVLLQMRGSSLVVNTKSLCALFTILWYWCRPASLGLSKDLIHLNCQSRSCLPHFFQAIFIIETSCS